MKNFFEDYIMYILILVLVFVIVLAFFVYMDDHNPSIITDDTRFTWAIIQLGNGELIEGIISSWRNFENSDMVQITINDITILTHASNILLCSECP